MGHFTHNCKLTGVPIKDKATLIVMKPNVNLYDNSEQHIKKYGKTSYISNDNTRMKFVPVWFPIHGKYNDYGGLENIIEDDNTKILENYYGLSIQELVDVVTCNRKDDGFDGSLDVIKKPKVYPKGMKKTETHFQFYQRIMNDPMPNGGRYPISPNNDYQIYRDGKFISVSKELYDSDYKEIREHYARYNKWVESNPDTSDDYGKPQYNERYKELLSLSGMWIHGEVYKRLTDLKKHDVYDKLDLGTPELLEYFGFVEGKRDNNERYNRVFVKDGLKINSDGTWIEIPGEFIYTLKQLKSYCSRNGVVIDIEEINKLGRIGQTYKLCLKNYKKRESFLKSREDSSIEYYFLGGLYNGHGKLNPLTDVYIEHAKKGELEENLIRFWNFNGYMYSMGAYYEIVGTGPQDGEFKDVRDVLQTALDITNEYIGKYYDEDDEDDDEGED